MPISVLLRHAVPRLYCLRSDPMPETMIVPTWWYLLAMCLAAGLIGMAKSGFAGGIGILAVPLTANVLPADQALGVLLPILIFGDIFASLHHFRNASRPHLRWLFGGAILGIAAGTLLLWWLQETGLATLTFALNLLVGGICLLLVLFQAWRLAGGKPPRVPATAGAGVATGISVGVVSTLAHSAGPIASIYLLEQQLDKTRLVATAAVFFFCVNVAKLPTYLGLGLIDPATLLQSAIFCLVVPIGTILGIWAHRRIPEKPFAALIYLGAAAAATRMIWNALA